MIKKSSLIICLSILLSAVANGQIAADKTKNPPRAKSLDYGLVIDNSGSFRTIFEEIIQSANAIIESNNPGDSGFLVRFVDSDKIHLIQDFTSSTDELKSAAEDMFIEGGQTAILDSVYFSAKHLAEKENSSPNREKVLILITDGEDRNSAAKTEDVVKFLKSERIKIYALGVSDGKIYKNLLDKLAKETGGKSFIVEKRSELKIIVKTLTIAIRTQ